MKIAIDARGINWYKGTGIGTYTYNVVKNLLQKDQFNSYELFWSGKNYSEFKNNKTTILMASRRHQRFFENIYIPNYIYNSNIDIYHIPQNGIGLFEAIECKKIVTIHDLIPYIMPDTVGKGYLKKFLEEMPKIIANCDGILTVSDWSKKDILKFFPTFPEERIIVTPLAADTAFMPLPKEQCKALIQKKYNFNKPYLLYLGGFSARKNVITLIEAFIKIQKDLNKDIVLLIGGALRDEGEKILNHIKDLDMLHKIIFTGFVEDELLPALYNGCEAFVYPSLYEGFGLPPLEAMSCKIPVITSNCTSIPEVVQDAGLLINPYNTDELCAAIVRVVNDDNLRYNLADKGFIRSKAFNWINTSINTLKGYQTIYNLG